MGTSNSEISLEFRNFFATCLQSVVDFNLRYCIISAENRHFKKSIPCSTVQKATKNETRCFTSYLTVNKGL